MRGVAVSLALFLGHVLGAGARNPSAADMPMSSNPGSFYGVDFAVHYPEFAVSALRFYTKVYGTYKAMPRDVALRCAEEMFGEYGMRLKEFYDVKGWLSEMEALAKRASEPGDSESYVADLLQKVKRTSPSEESRKKMLAAAESLYNAILEGSNLKSSQLDSTSVMFELYDLLLGMRYKVQE